MIPTIASILKDDLHIDTVHVSKFFHGDPAINKKILFYVSSKGKPFCIFKITRDPKYNDLIDREQQGILAFKSNITTPRVLLSGKIDGCAYICQGIISGTPLGKKRELSVLPALIGMHLSAKKGTPITLGQFVQHFAPLNLPAYWEHDDIVKLLLERKDDVIHGAPQHGDCTYKNILVEKNGGTKKPVLIDWEYFGLRSIWGIDLVHYLIRCTRTEGKDITIAYTSFIARVKEMNKYFSLEKIGLNERDLENLYLVDRFFDVLQKDFPNHYSDISKRMVSLPQCSQ
jgi:hypothetical protein